MLFFLLKSFQKMSTIIFGCVGALAILGNGHGLRMSFFRVAGSPGEADPNSSLNKFYLAQQLTAEWNGTLLPLFLALQAAKITDTAAVGTVVAITASRIAFGVKTTGVFPKAVVKPIGYVTMITTYLGTFYLGGRLIAHAL